MTIHVVRHCDVENSGAVIYGRLRGFGLSDLGRRQAERVGEYLSDTAVGSIVTSPLLRAVQTARALARHHPESVTRRSLLITEVRTSYQGLKSGDVPASINMFDNPREPTDETITDVFRRMRRFVDRTLREADVNRWTDVICVSHAAPISILRAGLEGLPLVVTSLRGEREPVKGSVTSLRFRDLALESVRYQDVWGSPSCLATTVSASP